MEKFKGLTRSSSVFFFFGENLHEYFVVKGNSKYPLNSYKPKSEWQIGNACKGFQLFLLGCLIIFINLRKKTNFEYITKKKKNIYIGPCFCCRPLISYVFCLFISIIVLFISLTLLKTKSTYELNPRYRVAFLNEYDLASYLSFFLFLIGFFCGCVGNLECSFKSDRIHNTPSYLN